MSLHPVNVLPAERRRARDFAALLEDSRPATGHELESLVALAATLRPAHFAPRAEFRAALRESLVAEAAARPVPARTAAVPQPRRHRLRTAVASAVVVSLVGGVGTAVASTHALPGDALYGLKRGLESAQLKFAHSDLTRGRDLLAQADHRLSEAEALAASENARSPQTEARIAQAIADLDTATRAGVAAFDAAYADTGDGAPLRELDRFAVDQRARLADLSALLSPRLRPLLAPLSARLVALSRRLATLVAGAAASPGSAVTPGATGGPNPLTPPSGVATAGIGGLTGGATPGGPAGGATGGKGGGATLPSAVPHVTLPASPVPGIPIPTASVPGLPVPSISVPSVSVPSVSAPISTPSLPVAPPTCVAIPPLTTC